MVEQRVKQIFIEEMSNDTSFTERPLLGGLFGGIRYKQGEVRKIWRRAIKHGIFLGLMKSSIKGRRISLNSSATTARQREYLEKSYKLAQEYNCCVQYHPQAGMVVTDLNI